MAIKIEALTDLGKRKDNQDSLLAMTLRSGGSDCIIAAVADGVGSLADSRLASQFLTARLRKYFDEVGEALFKGSFVNIQHSIYTKLIEAHDEMRHVAQDKGYEYGTTLTLLVVIENSYIVYQVGDSRCYCMSEGVVRQITRDQTVAEKERDLGIEIVNQSDDVKRSTILQCFGKGGMQPDVYTGILGPNFKLLVSTDGLTNNMRNREILSELSRTETTKHKLENLITTARGKGERDNISAILVEVM